MGFQNLGGIGEEGIVPHGFIRKLPECPASCPVLYHSPEIHRIPVVSHWTECNPDAGFIEHCRTVVIVRIRYHYDQCPCKLPIVN